MKKDLKMLEKTFESMNNDRGKLGLNLLNEATFLSDTLEKLKKIIKKEELVEDMSQGTYSIRRANPALSSYNTSIKNYQSLIKQINELLPTEVIVDDEFEKFDE